MTEPTYLFVTGMFRSGTTLLARMLHAHPKISFASDPFRPMFNDFRDRIAETNGIDGITPLDPLGNYFCDELEWRVMKAVQNSDFNVDLNPNWLKALIPVMEQRTRPFSPRIAERMGEVQGNTYAELYRSMMDLVQSTYGKKSCSIIGIKEVWCTEFAQPLLKTFPNIKIISLVRDPRAVAASNQVTGRKYPWLFLARQWRKLAAFAWFFANHSECRRSVLLLDYETLVKEPEKTARRISDFLGISFDRNMIDGSKFKDGAGQPWLQNSSYETSNIITTQSLDRWKQTLSPEEIRFLELLCYPDMVFFGYDPISKGVESLHEHDILKPLIISKNQLSEWIQKFSDDTVSAHITEMLREWLRRRLLACEDEQVSVSAKKTIEYFFLSQEYFNALHQMVLTSLNSSHC